MIYYQYIGPGVRRPGSQKARESDGTGVRLPRRSEVIFSNLLSCFSIPADLSVSIHVSLHMSLFMYYFPSQCFFLLSLYLAVCLPPSLYASLSPSLSLFSYSVASFLCLLSSNSLSPNICIYLYLPLSILRRLYFSSCLYISHSSSVSLFQQRLRRRGRNEGGRQKGKIRKRERRRR